MRTGQCSIVTAMLAGPLLGFAAGVEAQTTWFVDADAPGPADGLTWATAFLNPQDALAAASAGDTIRVARGTYMPDGARVGDAGHVAGSGSRSATFQLLNNVTIEGAYAGFGEADPDLRDVAAHATVLSGDLTANDGPNFANDGENSRHVVTASGTDATAVLDGCTITAGRSDGTGDDRNGAGIFNETGSPTIRHCHVTANHSTRFGGGMYNVINADPTVTNCTFSGNTAAFNGGGMYNLTDSHPTVTNCTFSGNTGNAGGGMYNDNANPATTNCTFSGNTAAGGGAMYNRGSSPTVTNCTFSGNSANLNGGGMYNNNSNSIVTNCLLWGNTAGISENQILNSGSTPFIAFCDIKGSGGSGPGWDASLGTDAGGNLDADPQFVDADGADNTAGTDDDDLRLLAISPAIDAGDNFAVPPDLADLDADGDTAEPTPYDLDGNPRFLNDLGVPDTGNGTPPIVDMGPYERFGVV